MTFKYIKYFLALSALTVCWQISPLAMENQGDAMDVEQVQGGHKRSATQAGFFMNVIGSSFEEFPPDVKRYLVNCFDLKKDQNTLLSLMASCKGLQAIIMAKYEKENEEKHHYSWAENPSLYPSTVYILNARMSTILGLYVNMKCFQNMVSYIDEPNFTRLCTQFMDKSLFSEGSVPNMYVDLLQCSVTLESPNLFQDPFLQAWQTSFNTKRDNCIVKLSSMLSPIKQVLQNESALYFHYCHFLAGMQDAQLAFLKNTELYRSLNGSLMGVMNPELLTLKRTPHLSAAANFAATWKRILELEPAVTVQQLNNAGDAHFRIGFTETNPATKAANFVRAAAYYKEELEGVRASGENPRAFLYGDIARAYFSVGENEADPATKVANYAKAAEYGEEHLKAIRASGKNPPASLYSNIARAYLRVGENEADPATKAVAFAKAAEHLKTSLSIGLDDVQAKKAQEMLETIAASLDDSNIEFDKATVKTKGRARVGG